ncbi:MAG TPA: hypothetical protein V6C86_11025 [Oculatellaceae cyanobacterium]
MLSIFTPFSSAFAYDWGYDSPPSQAKEQSKPAPAFTENDQLIRPASNTSKVNTSTVSSTRVKSTKADKPTKVAAFAQPDVIDVDKAVRSKQARLDLQHQQDLEKYQKLASKWLELYSLVSAEPLTDEQKSRLNEKLLKAASKNSPGFAAIDKFWPQVKKVCLANTEQQANYRDLLRALFRLELREAKANSLENEIVSEVIGPERIAVPDKPPLTEDAVEAYADMTCFIYNQTHPGKTVDALDNRTVFVGTLEKRYMNTTNPLEKLAMSNFALKWSKFKVLYADASDTDKDKLFKRISGASPESLRKDISNPALDALMNNGPWVHALTTTSDNKPVKL